MDSNEIRHILKGVSLFRGVYPRNAIPSPRKKPAAFIVNTDPASGKGEHWVALLIQKSGRGEYFDPFGFPAVHPDFLAYLRATCPKGWTYNSKSIQNPASTLCGLFCAEYIKARARYKSLKNFLSRFSSNTALNDGILLRYSGRSRLSTRTKVRHQRGRRIQRGAKARKKR